ncbi:AMP-binding protein [Acidimangrovimonas pyrenivorans]|uniref:AMP-binding protein n=1 Tax=Acidimangrovimonas pyrenivorans TaxID=2030798 RepID=A0ABV7AHB3_9RHOB
MAVVKSRFGEVALRDQSITERLFEGISGRGADPVLIDGPTGREVTAEGLTGMIKALAGGLTERGLGKGHVLALMAPNLPEFAAVFHGTCWAGGTVTTINPTYTWHEVNHQLTDSDAEILVTISHFAETAQKAVEGTRVREIVLIDGDITPVEGTTPFSALMGPPLAAQAPVDYDTDIAVLPYSSGTTGLPKGVMLSHRNLVANVDQSLATTDTKPGERTVGFLPFFHIYGMTVLMNVALVAGGTVVTMPRFDLELFLKLNQDHKARQLWLVPPVAVALAKHPLVDQYDLSTVAFAVSAAAPLGADLANALGQRLGCEAAQGYGMTELSPVSHVSPHGLARAGSVGLAVPSTDCRIVDPETLLDVATGEEGELWVRGPQVMKGYLNNPEATAETIVEGGWLRTGDLGCHDADGYLYIRDRVKELIKYKGFQVPPAELEAVLMAHPAIADAAVIGLPDDEAGEVPVAFVVPAPGAAPTVEEILAHTGEQLAHYKQPARVIFAETIPKSASGKILRRELKAQLTAT